MSRTTSSVVSTLPTSTTNMTGFLATMRGRELAEALAHRLAQDRAIEEADSLRLWRTWLEDLSVQSLEVLDDRAERERREEGERADDHDHRDEEGGEERAVGGERAEAGRNHLLVDHQPGDRRAPE